MGNRLGPWLLFALATGVSAVFAYLSWHLVEKRALAWKPRSAASPAVRASAAA